MLKIALCDDSAVDLARLNDVLSLYVRRHSDQAEIFRYNGGEELLRDMQDFDVVFLDIEMNGINGIETARRIRGMDLNVPIVYVTGYSKYWRSAYKVHAFDFIQKPYIEGDIFNVMDDFLASVKQADSVKVQIETSRGVEITEASEVCYLLIQKKREVIVGLRSGEIVSNETLTALAEKFSSEPLFQTHRSCYINLKYVHSYSKSDGVVMSTGTWLPLARQRQDEFLFAMGKFLRKR